MSVGGTLARGAFWLGGAAVASTYVVLPAIVLIRGRLVHRPVHAAPIEPSVSVVIAAHDEAPIIGSKLDSVLEAEYPGDRLEVIVASDGSTDGTQAVVASYSPRGVRLLDLDRVGKADALNAAIAATTGEIVVFTDANSMLAPGALRAIVAPFADPEVGGVAGDQRYRRGGEDAVGAGERSYWDLDRMLKRAESRAGSVVSATGALYAVRRELVRPVRAGVTDDFITSTAVVLAGRRLVFADDAAAYEPVASSGGVEFGRKVRIMTRGLSGVVAHRALLDPRRTGFYALELLWHKLLRRLVVVPLVAVALASLVLARDGLLYRLALAGQVGVYGLGVVGLVAARGGRRGSRLVALPAYFLVVNGAALVALWNLVRGRRIDRWEPQRGSAEGATAADPATEPPAAAQPTTTGERPEEAA
ncbi:MAG TPA: glycosyltransferase family 2 protein [Candidatus Limnocylindrales bacterium]|nr:glycosyltransferase family 2 protein [Candidatus Limnocylindrales bacterium]